MLIGKLKTIGKIVGVTFVLGISAIAQTQAAPVTSVLSSGSVFCLPAKNLANLSSLSVFGGATDKEGNAAFVKWTVWAGASQFPPPISSAAADRLFKQDNAQSVAPTVNKDQINTNFVWTQACVVNTTSDFITFFLQETPQ